MNTTAPPVPRRHALGLPAGSVRSILALLVVALLCGVLLLPTWDTEHPQPIPPYLVYLVFLILGHFFASHVSHTPGEQAPPLYLRRGLVRLAIIVALGATVGWKIYSDSPGMQNRWNHSVDAIKEQWFMPLLLLGGFFVGVVVRTIVGRDNPPIAVQDFEAWLALIAAIGLCIAAIVHLVIEPASERGVSHPGWESFLAAAVVFYFGARS